MNENLPDDVKRALSDVLIKIGNVISETNAELTRLGFQEYSTVAGSIFYNDPGEFCEVPCLNVVVHPLMDENPDEPSFVEVTEKKAVAIYSPVTGKAKFRTLTATNLSLGVCAPRQKGKRCNPIDDGKLVMICKEIQFSGKVSFYLCRPSKADY